MNEKVATKGNTKWDEQGQNSTSASASKQNTKALGDIDSGSQFVDFISKEGSYQPNSTKGELSMELRFSTTLIMIKHH